MKLYSKETIQSIQAVINTAKFDVKTYNNYDFLLGKTINSADIKVRFLIDPSTERRDAYLITDNTDLTSAYISEWKTTAIGKFMIKDFKKDRRDFIGNSLYHLLSITVSQEPLHILVRLLDDIAMPDITEEDKENLIKTYGDLTIDGKYFSIIKIMRNVDHLISWDRYVAYDDNIEKRKAPSFKSDAYIEELNEENAEDIPDDSTQVDALF